ncbi:MAG: PD-(D/E)XK nuclease family protein [Geminicoccaceae bacterium]
MTDHYDPYGYGCDAEQSATRGDVGQRQQHHSMTPLQVSLRAIQANIDAGDHITAAKASGLMVGYDARWRDSGWRAISLEETVQLPIVNPQTGKTSRTWTQAGKFDGVATYGGRPFLLEHKTTTEDISNPDAPYWRRLAIDSQVYFLQNWQHGRRLEGCLYDVIRKPTIRPKDIAKATLARIVSEGTYCGQKLPDHLRQAVANGQSRECPELYGIRLAADTLEKPDKYFARRNVPRLDNEVVEWAQELWDVARDIREASNRDAHYRNSHTCMQYGRPCEFLGICSGHDEPDSDRWKRRENVHIELDGIDGDSRKVLTHSRVKCFQACRRKHQLRYELGIERVEEEEKEALYFGSVFHAALEAWWSCYLEKENGEGSHSASEADRHDSQAMDA